MEQHKQRKIGKVVSTQMMSTIVVSVDAFVSHPLYKKKIRRTRRFLVHDPENKAKLGDVVVIEETRPISKLKHWKLIEIKETSSDLGEVSDIDLAAITAKTHPKLKPTQE